MAAAAQSSYIPFYRELLRTIALPNWSALALAITIVEGAVAFMILSGAYTRIAAIVGTLLSLNYVLAFALCNCPWAVTDFPLVFWFYFAFHSQYPVGFR